MFDTPPPSPSRGAAWTARGAEGVDAMARLAYDELRALAHRYLKGERFPDLLQTTGLAHEAFLRLRTLDKVSWESRRHFLAVAATQMRRILVDHARAVSARKRGERPRLVTLQEAKLTAHEPSVDLLAVDQALHRLGRRSRRQSRVAELRLFVGLSVEETAETLAVSPRTVKADWKFAKAWLARELRVEPGERP